MAIKKQFELTNTVSTGLYDRSNAVDIKGTRITGFCTAASLLFAKKCLEVSTWFPNSRKDASWDDGLAQVMMHKLNKQNNDPDAMAETAGLRQTTGHKKTSSAELVQMENSHTNSQIGIFWNNYHTIGIRQAKRGDTVELHVWDQNFGFFTMEKSELGSYYKERYSQCGWKGRDQLQGYMGLSR